MKDENRFRAKGDTWHRIRSTVFLLPAWFSPHKRLRVFFHRLRGVDVGRNVEIGYYCIIGHVHPSRIHIGDNAVVTANSVILEHDSSYYYTHGGEVTFGDVYIGKGAFLGIGTVVMPGIEIGDCAIVGALSLVKSDVPSHSVAAGQPARIIKRFSEENSGRDLDSDVLSEAIPVVELKPRPLCPTIPGDAPREIAANGNGKQREGTGGV